MTQLVSENEFTKIFKKEEDNIDLYVSKAYDEESDKHYLVASIPVIEELGVQGIQLPLQYETSEQRDLAFTEFDGEKLIFLILQDIKAKQEELKKIEKSN